MASQNSSALSSASPAASPDPFPPCHRVLLKLSGEALQGDGANNLSTEALTRLAGDIREVHARHVQVCVVVGGGNIFRGISGAADGIPRATADGMGMLATLINALALQSALERMDVPTRVQSAIRIDAISEPFIRRRATRHMEKGRVVIFAAGTGNPYFTTDTAAALRAAEMQCDLLVKGTQVDGVYSADPKTDPEAVRYARLTFGQVLRDDLKVMDASAISLARENRIPILVFSIHESGAFAKVIRGEGKFTIISGEDKKNGRLRS